MGFLRKDCWRSAALTHTGLKRKRNEDSILAAPDQGVWVVADGMGGHDRGDVASRLVIEQFGDSMADEDFDLSTCLADAHARIFGQTEGENSRMGSTAVALRLHDKGRSFEVAWVGDSRCYRLRDRQLDQLSQDHTVVGELFRRGVISAEEAERHPERSTLSRALGRANTHQLQVESCRGDTRPGDLFLLCSDGLSGVVDAAEIQNWMSGVWGLDYKLRQLLNAALGQGAPDNVSIILVRVGAGAGQ